MSSLLALLLVVIMLVAAVAVLALPNLVGALAAASVVSLALSVVFVLLQAPDVALTEAAVGAGLSGVVMALGLWRMRLARVENAEGGEAGHDA